MTGVGGRGWREGWRESRAEAAAERRSGEESIRR